MSTQAGRRLAREREPEEDWEDKYRKLRAQHSELRVLCNQQEELILKLQTKIRVLEANFAQIGGNEQFKLIPVKLLNVMILF